MSLAKKILFGIALPTILVLIPLISDVATAAGVPPEVQTKCSSAFGFVIPNTDNTYTCSTPTIQFYLDSGGNEITRNGLSSLTNTGADIVGYDARGAAIKNPTSCAGVLTFIANPFTCMFRTFVVGLGSLLMSVTAWLLGVVGLLFDWLVGHTIVTFRTSLFDKVSSGVTTGWEAFRDVANILIIGIFVFVAISIILGLKEYGQKKYVARILVVAILINFSFLFTEMIVDFSNFTAMQLYSAAHFPDVNSTNGADGVNININPNSGGNPIPSYPNAGIGGHFIALTGVTGMVDAGSNLWQIAERNDSGWLALVHGLFAATLYLAAAIVLLYGSYVLLVRAILIIFLLLTSSLAFASYIIPYKAFTDKGWTLWWNSLLKTAVLAPLLMLFLFITTTIADALTRNAGGSLAGLATANPPATSVAVLFNYLIILGLLFASFKVANSIASSIAGFNIPAMVTTGTVGMAARIAAPVLQRTVGFGASLVQKGRLGEMKAARDTSAGLGLSATQSRDLQRDAIRRAEEAREQAKTLKGNPKEVERLRGLAKSADAAAKKHADDAAETEKQKRRQDEIAARRAIGAARAGNVADKKFNLMNTRPAKVVASAAGLKGVFESGRGAKGYVGRADDRAKAIAKMAEKIQPSQEDKEKARILAEKTQREQMQGQKNLIQATLSAARITADAEKQNIDRAVAGRDNVKALRDGELVAQTKELNLPRYQEEHSTIDNARGKQDKSAEAWKKDLTEHALSAITDTAQKADLETRLGKATSAEEIKTVQNEVLGALSPEKAGEVQEKLNASLVAKMIDAAKVALPQVDDAKRAEIEEKLTKAGSGPASASEIRSIHDEILSAVDPNKRAAVQQQLNESSGSHESEMRHEEARIRAARESITKKALENQGELPRDLQERIRSDKTNMDTFDVQANDARGRKTSADAEVNRLTRETNEFNAEIERRAKAAGTAIVNAMTESALDEAGRVGQRQGGALGSRIVGALTGGNRRMGEAVSKIVHDKQGKQQRLSQIVREIEAEENPPANPEPAAASKTLPTT